MYGLIRIPARLWRLIEDKALNFRDESKPLVFACYSKKRTYWDIVDVREIPTVKSKGRDKNGFFIYTYPGIKKMGFYPQGEPIQFSGTIVIGDDVSLSLMDAYWMAKDHMDFRIKIKRDCGKNLVYKAWAVDHKLGLFYEVNVDIIDSLGYYEE